MTSKTVLVSLWAAVAPLACDSQASGAATESASPSASSAPAAQPASSPSAAASAPPCTYHHPDPKFCFTPPNGYEPQPKEQVGNNTRLPFQKKEGGGYMSLELSGTSADFPWCKNMKENAAADVVVHDDDSGGCWEDTILDGPMGKYHRILFYRKGPKGWIFCQSNRPPDEDVPAVLAACRGIRFE